MPVCALLPRQPISGFSPTFPILPANRHERSLAVEKHRHGGRTTIKATVVSQQTGLASVWACRVHPIGTKYFELLALSMRMPLQGDEDASRVCNHNVRAGHATFWCVLSIPSFFRPMVTGPIERGRKRVGQWKVPRVPIEGECRRCCPWG
jgi:hypothetical protein